LAASIIGREDFLEIYLCTPLSICENRDVKGLYRKARKGLIKNFTGVDSPYEKAKAPFLSIDTTNLSVEECVNLLFEKIYPFIRL
jgi:adenylylsulfate kinase